MNCPICGCPAERHWPEHGRTTTACADCIDAGRMVETRPDCRGICCYPAPDLRRLEQP